MAAIVRKVTLNAKDQRCSSSVLPTWGDIYRLRVMPSSHAAVPPDPQFSHLLNRSVPSSRYVSLSLEDCARLESCLQCFVSSLSFASWIMVSLFVFLCYTGLSPSGDEFNNVESSLSVALTAQAKSSYVVSIFLRHVLRETYIAHLPAHTHDSVKPCPVFDSIGGVFVSAEVIQRSLGQVREVFTVAAAADFVVLEECIEFGFLFFRSCYATSSLSWSSTVYFFRFVGLSVLVSWFKGLQTAASPSPPARRRSLNCSSKSPAKEMANCRK